MNSPSMASPDAPKKSASSLEALFDLTFAICFGLAAEQLAHGVAEGHTSAALIGFGFASFAICWAWINFSWFASAFGADDWAFRLLTMLQMVGVLVLSIGLPRLFDSLEKGEHVDNSILVLGYVIMRVAMIAQWLRAARHDPARRQVCLTYVAAIAVAQIGWVAQIFFDTSVGPTLLMAAVLGLIELAGPIVAERKGGGTPWIAHHIAERYSVFAMIALGEAIVGTVAALSAVIEAQGWSPDAALVCVAGIGLTFGMWWVYDLLPSAAILHTHRDRAFVWGYGQVLVVAAIVGTGAGLRIAAAYIAHKSHAGALATLLSVAIPVSIYLGALSVLHFHLVRRRNRSAWWRLAGTAVTILVALVAAFAGIDMTICLLILMLAPIAAVVGHRMQVENDVTG